MKGQVWELSYEGTITMLLLLGESKAHPNGRNRLLRALTLHHEGPDQAMTCPGQVDWWSDAWFEGGPPQPGELKAELGARAERIA